VEKRVRLYWALRDEIRDEMRAARVPPGGLHLAQESHKNASAFLLLLEDVFGRDSDASVQLGVTQIRQ